MSQININGPDQGDHAAAAGTNLLAVLIVLIVLLALAWFLFAGPLHAIFSGTSSGPSNINVNPPNINVNVNPPANTNPGTNSGGQPNTNPGTNSGGSGGYTAPSSLKVEPNRGEMSFGIG